MVKETSYFTHAEVLATIANNIFLEYINVLCDFYDWWVNHIRWIVCCHKYVDTSISIDDLTPRKSDRAEETMQKGDHSGRKYNVDVDKESESDSEKEHIKRFGVKTFFWSLIDFW